MPQVQLPIFPAGSVEINRELACRVEGERVVFFNGHLPVFAHAKSDLASFRLFTSQLIVQGSATQGHVAKAFGVPLVAIKRATKLYRERGPAGFFVSRPRREGSKLNAEKLEQARVLLGYGYPLPVVSAQTGGAERYIAQGDQSRTIAGGKKNAEASAYPASAQGGPLESTGSAAGVCLEVGLPVDSGQAVAGLLGDKESAGAPSTLTERSLADSQAEMGYGTTRPLERVMASCGLLASAELEFIAADDVPNGGVLCALPALLAEGLLRHTRSFYRLAPGFYPLESIFLALALLALVRCPFAGAKPYLSPRGVGQTAGPGSVAGGQNPAAKNLSTVHSGRQGGPMAVRRLAGEWMAGVKSDSVGLFYADGHVRVYHGSLTELPRRYVARERLCLRGTTDYWINGLDGAPFFVLTQPVNPGLIAVLRQSIVPRLLAQAPQPQAQALKADPLLARFTLIFDREGYSPDFFAELKAQRIAILTYHKFPGQHWPPAEFVNHWVQLPGGQTVELKLAERGTRLSNGLWVREIRELSATGTQSSILSTDMGLDLTRIAARMGARWSQENFLKYMREHYGLDRLIEYGTQPLPEAMVVVNPAWRRLNQSVRKETAQLYRLRAEFGARSLPSQPSAEEVENFERRGGELRDKIQAQELKLTALKEQRRQTSAKLTLKELPEAERFAQLKTEKKHFVDTIKLIAYRAESALVGEVREALARDDDARALLRRLFVTPANLRPDPPAKTLTVELHRLGSPLQDAAVARLCQLLTDSETVFPTTNLRLIFRQVGST